MLGNDAWRGYFERGLDYKAYLAQAKENERPRWQEFGGKVALTAEQVALLKSFTRRLPVLCVSGTWCGDCVQQVPMLDHIQRGNALIEVRYLERDANLELAEKLKICGGQRVPVVVFFNEDFDFVGLAGDRTISRYRALAARQLGPSCPLPGAPVPADEVAATLGDWVTEFERASIILRLSTKLRQRHGD